MTSFHQFSAFAASRDEGLHPKLQALLERSAAAPFSELSMRHDSLIQAGPSPDSELELSRVNVMLFRESWPAPLWLRPNRKRTSYQRQLRDETVSFSYVYCLVKPRSKTIHAPWRRHLHRRMHVRRFRGDASGVAAIGRPRSARRQLSRSSHVHRGLAAGNAPRRCEGER